MLLVQAISDNFIKDLEDGVLRRWLEAELPKALGFFWTIGGCRRGSGEGPGG